MSKLLLKPAVMLPRDDLDRIEDQIVNDLEKNGFAIIPPIFEVYEIEDPKGADE